LIGGISGQSESNLREILKEVSDNKPALVFIDDIDAIIGKKENA
jgi:ribosome biogenesis ATPase